MKVSYSRLKAWTECPLSYKLRYLDKVGEDDSDGMEIGSAAHDFFEAWVGDFPKDWASLARSCWSHEGRNQDNFKAYMQICADFVENWNHDDIPPKSHVIKELEIALNRDREPVDWNANDAYFRAKVDRIDLYGDVAQVTDYKTSFAGKADKFQLELYAWVILKKFPGINRFNFVIHYTRSGWKERWSVDKENIGPIEFQLAALLDAIEKDRKFRAKPGIRCSSCTVAHSCTKKASKKVGIESKKKAEKVAGEILALAAQLKSKKKILQEWAKIHGEVRNNGVMFGFFPVESFNVEAIQLIEALSKHGYASDRCIRPNTTEIKKLCRKDDAFANAISPYVTVDVNLRFDSRKTNDE